MLTELYPANSAASQAQAFAKQPLRWGIIGCGAVTEVKSGPAYQQVPGFVLQAVMRRDAAKAEDYARRHQVPLWFSDADLLINHPDVDAVYIATPPDSHLFYALKVAAAGKICCVEKPMALNTQQCAEQNAAFAAVILLTSPVMASTY